VYATTFKDEVQSKDNLAKRHRYHLDTLHKDMHTDVVDEFKTNNKYQLRTK